MLIFFQAISTDVIVLILLQRTIGTITVNAPGCAGRVKVVAFGIALYAMGNSTNAR